MGSVNLDNTGSGSAITLSSDGTSLLLDGTAIGGGGGGDPALYADNAVTATTPLATGDNAVAIGSGAVTSSKNSVAIGTGTDATGIASTGEATAIGNLAQATGNYSTSIGTRSVASGGGATAIGRLTDALVGNALALGTQAYATGQDYSTAIGKSYSFGNTSLAVQIGSNSSSYGAIGNNSIALGQLAKATLANSIAIGDAALSDTANLIALGGTTDTVKISGAYTLPTTDGTAGQVLSTDGSGNLSWITP